MAGLGGKRDGAGRPKGIPNKSTIDAREAIADFVNGNVDRLNGWLDRIADENPKAAFDAFMSVIEYNIPKLARTENKTEHSGKVTVTWSDSEQTEDNLANKDSVQT